MLLGSMKTLMLAPCVYGGFFVTVALTHLPFRLYHSVLLKRETAVSRRTRMINRFMVHSSFLVSTGNGRHILPQTSTICCSGDSPEVRTRSFAALRMTYPLQAVTLSAAKGLARRMQRSKACAQD